MHRYRYEATVIRWVDGDTVDCVVDLGFQVQIRERFRLLGVDAPERGQAGYHEAMRFCESVAPPGSHIDIESHKAGKYGRWLAVIFPMPGTTDLRRSLNRQLITEGLAVPYGS